MSYGRRKISNDNGEESSRGSLPAYVFWRRLEGSKRSQTYGHFQQDSERRYRGTSRSELKS